MKKEKHFVKSSDFESLPNNTFDNLIKSSIKINNESQKKAFNNLSSDKEKSNRMPPINFKSPQPISNRKFRVNSFDLKDLSKKQPDYFSQNITKRPL